MAQSGAPFHSRLPDRGGNPPRLQCPPLSNQFTFHWSVWLDAAANFIITGSLILTFAIGLGRTLQHSAGSIWASLLIGLAGIGLIGAGFFTTDPIFGYPPSAPLVLAQYSTHGHLHDLFSILVFLGLPIACFVLTRRFFILGKRGWAIYSMLTGMEILVTFVLAGIGFNQTPGFVNFAGIYQRLAIIIGWTWMTLLALHFLGVLKNDALETGSTVPK